MLVRDVQEVLTPLGLLAPDLEMLRADEKRYQCLLLQPSGPIYAGTHRIGSLDETASSPKASRFLELAAKNGAHLAVTPEYFLPWTALQNAILTGAIPGSSALWVLGCASIQSDQLEAFKSAVTENCIVVFESLAALAADRAFLDPVVLLFKALQANGTEKLVALVQFKTFPSRDNTFLEEGLLKRGTIIYRFKGKAGPLSVATIVCSDAFAVDGQISGLINQSTLLHIQLNQKPRNSVYRQYRKTAFETDARASECHIVCLNWARSVVQHNEDGHTETWPNVAGSSWYCPDASAAGEDAIVGPNHMHGLYYTYMHEKRHALLFHYDEAVFELQVPKVLSTGAAIMANRTGPSAKQRHLWDSAAAVWYPAPTPADPGFEALLLANSEAKAALAHAAGSATALDIERLLALSAGAIAGIDKWFAAREVDSCQIAADEVVCRVTVPQDDTDHAVAFRQRRLVALVNVRHFLDTIGAWPPQVMGIDKDALIEWKLSTANFNVRRADGRPALVAYLGESPDARMLENVTANLINLLRRAGGVNQKSLCILYRHLDTMAFAPLPGLTQFDDALNDETDILSVHT